MLRKAPFGLVLGTLASPASATLVLYDSFDYSPAGTEISTADGTGGWLKVPSAATLEPTIASGNLPTYPGLPWTPAGNSVAGTGGATPVQASSTLAIPGQPYVTADQPTLYYSMLFNVSIVDGTALSTGSFVAGFRNNTSTGGLASFEAGAPLLIRQTATGSGLFQLGTGLTQENADRTWDTANSYDATTGTMLLVLSYQFVSDGEDFARLWVNPDPALSEAGNSGPGLTVGNALKVAATANDGHGISQGRITNFFLRNNGAAPDNWSVDELRISTSWEDVFTTAVPGVWLGGTGNWSDSAQWSGNVVPNGAAIPVRIDKGNAAASTLTLNQDATVRTIALDAGDTFTIPSGRVLALAGAGSVLNGVFNSSGTLTAPGMTISGAGAELRWIEGAINVGSAQLTAGGKLIISPGGNKVLKVASASVDVAGGSKVDLGDNKLITSGALGTWDGSTYTGLSGLVDSGRGSASNAQWDGSGIVTSDTRAVNNNDLVSIGTARVADFKGIADTATTTFAGQTVLGSDSVAMVTWGGDANLDGKINIDDYGQIDFNVSSSGSVFGWYNGDFNYDGKINIDDYGIIDFNVSAQTGIFPTAGGFDVLTAAVPEPASLGLVGIATGAWLRRRRRTCARD